MPAEGPRKLLLASGNPHKREEMRRLLEDLPVTLLSLADWPGLEEPVENGVTFADNARLKALYYAQATGVDCVADDSGLEVEALDGRPGVRSARFAGEGASDADNRALLLQQLTGVPAGSRAARFCCTVALVEGGQVRYCEESHCGGWILEQEQGQGGFGYDALFFSPALGVTFAEASPAAKDGVSHRGQALRKLRRFLQAEFL